VPAYSGIVQHFSPFYKEFFPFFGPIFQSPAGLLLGKMPILHYHGGFPSFCAGAVSAALRIGFMLTAGPQVESPSFPCISPGSPRNQSEFYGPAATPPGSLFINFMQLNIFFTFFHFFYSYLHRMI
jgi:hypothetical protein